MKTFLMSLLIGLIFLGAGAQSAFAEGPPNWLSEEIQKIRKEYKLEARQHRQIKLAIESHKEGKELAKNPKLEAAITKGIKAADKRQAEIDKNPKLMTASPHVQASWTIFEELGVEVPQPGAGASP